MPVAFPVSLVQFWAFLALSLVFLALVFRAGLRRSKENGARQDGRSRLGIVFQSIGIGLAGIGGAKPTLAPLGTASLIGTGLVTLFMGIAIGLFARSSAALGRNWSIVARTRTDHELVRGGPYAYVRHPIYLGMLFFLLGLATALGHLLQLLIAVPVFLAGTAIRTRVEDRLLERSFGDAFREYRSSTPALIPRFF